MNPTIDFKRSSDVVVAARVATAGRLLERVGIDGVGDPEEKDMTGNEPSDHEDAKGNVAGDLELEVF